MWHAQAGFSGTTWLAPRSGLTKQSLDLGGVLGKVEGTPSLWPTWPQREKFWSKERVDDV
ncbi:hypothetical protein AA105894_0614 [Asaia spathodeae NBRC 105894]|nr:hypothetical protein AA105894_0614 [Asaia spathodeae NBRC 105894]